ncbi:hypothetical protein BXZ70DRAFT_1010945 [Cristinia sonorae]|uniref:F-box domain-containing protein n=1 Tax=Cristinia sonorae TaxID=1940300 RepID=A0A8K0UHL7_9AGAR|nr:hypothetical protein BXZ70DRAFT_1010945 [Cristinia sonorae]
MRFGSDLNSFPSLRTSRRLLTLPSTNRGVWKNCPNPETMKNKASQLPPEIIDFILQNLNNSDLKACTLLSRNCYSRAREWLFYTFKASWSWREVDTLRSVASGSEIPLTVLALYVKDLTLTRSGHGRPTAEDVRCLIARLPLLHTLRMSGFAMQNLSVPPRSLTLSRPLRLLQLSRIRFFLPSPLRHKTYPPDVKIENLPKCSIIDLLSLFPSIDTLHLDSVHIGILRPHNYKSPFVIANSDFSNCITPLFPSFSSLGVKTLIINNPEHFPTLLPLLATSSSIRSVELKFWALGDGQPLLSALEPQLRNVHLGLPDLKGNESRYDLSTCTNLTTLHCTGTMRGMTSRDTLCLLRHVVADPSLKSLSRVIIELRHVELATGGVKRLGRFDWGFIDKHFAARQETEEVTIKLGVCPNARTHWYYTDVSKEELAECMRRKLRRLNARNILNVSLYEFRKCNVPDSLDLF